VGAISKTLYIFGLQRRAPMMLLSMGILGVAWYLLGINPNLVAAIGGLIVVSWLTPERYSNIVSGIGMIAVGVFLYFNFAGGTRTGLLTGLIGAVFLVMGAMGLRRS